MEHPSRPSLLFQGEAPSLQLVRALGPSPLARDFHAPDHPAGMGAGRLQLVLLLREQEQELGRERESERELELEQGWEREQERERERELEKELLQKFLQAR